MENELYTKLQNAQDNPQMDTNNGPVLYLSKTG